jgi:hypothetical protein
VTAPRTAPLALGVALAITAIVALQVPGVVLDPAGVLWGAPDADTLGLVWTLWHTAEHLSRFGTLGLESQLAGFPDGGTVWPANPVEAVLVAPITALAGPAVAYNLLQLLHPGAAAGAVVVLARRVGAGAWGAALAGLATGLSPVLLCSAHNGNVEMGQLYWLPLAGIAAWAAARRGGWLRVTVAGATVGAALIAHVYLGIMAAIVAAAMVAAAPGATVDRARRLAAIGAVALAVAGPVMALAWSLTAADTALVGKDLSIVGRMRLLEGQTPLLRLLAPGPVVARDPNGDPGAYLNAASPGLALLGLGLWGATRQRDRLSRALTGLGAAGALMALGPTLVLWDQPLVVAGRQVPLPFLLLDAIPPFPMMIELWRFSALLHLALALAAALAIGRWGRRGAAAALSIVLLEATLLSPGRAVFETTPLPGPDLQQTIDAIPQPGAVLSWPLSLHLWPLLAQTGHGQPISLGPDRVSDPDLLTAMRRPDATAETLRTAARAKGFRWLLVHDRHASGAPREDAPLLDALAGTGAVVTRHGAAGLVDLDDPGPWPPVDPEGPKSE